jgi:hypothetical protein
MAAPGSSMRSRLTSSLPEGTLRHAGSGVRGSDPLRVRLGIDGLTLG